MENHLIKSPIIHEPFFRRTSNNVIIKLPRFTLVSVFFFFFVIFFFLHENSNETMLNMNTKFSNRPTNNKYMTKFIPQAQPLHQNETFGSHVRLLLI